MEAALRAAMKTSPLHRGGSNQQAGITMYPALPLPLPRRPGARVPQIPAVWPLWRALWPWRSKHPWEVCTRL